MATLWRIVPEHRAPNAFDGEGARLFGGRWNSRGIRIVYTSGSRALAALEVLVHLTPETLRRRYSVIGMEISDRFIETWPAKKLPADWRSTMIPLATRKLGDEWVRGARSAVLRIPSTIIPEEANFLINPGHPDVAPLRPADPEFFTFDPRLMRAG